MTTAVGNQLRVAARWDRRSIRNAVRRIRHCDPWRTLPESDTRGRGAKNLTETPIYVAPAIVEGGRVAEIGAHEELVLNAGAYKRLLEAQLTG